MIMYKIKDFLSSEKEIDYEDNDLEVYVVRNNEEILYVGMAKHGIYRRWFIDPGHHIYLNKNNLPIRGYSKIGNRIMDDLPRSMDWEIDLWSIKDLLLFFNKDYRIENKKMRIDCFYTGLDFECSLKYIEGYLIVYLNPLLNIIGNNSVREYKHRNFQYYKEYVERMTNENLQNDTTDD